jgi:guanylate kinase
VSTVDRASRAFPIVVSGPSGVGKTTIVDRVLETDRSLRESISATTRPPRDEEVPGTHYFFVTAGEFEQMKQGDLIEWAEVHDECYGTPRRFVEEELESGREVILNIDIQGAESVKKAFPDAVMVFILPPSFETLEKRIRKRGEDENIDIPTRLQTAREEITASGNYDYIIINDDIATAVAQLCAIITAERCRAGRQIIELE